jgi:hypothetical protein
MNYEAIQVSGGWTVKNTQTGEVMGRVSEDAAKSVAAHLNRASRSILSNVVTNVAQ